MRFNLAPPLFAKRDRHSGLLIKREFGPWVIKAFSLLASLKALRGSAFDLFGYSEERQLERTDIAEFEFLLDEITQGISDENYAVAVELVNLAQELRGFGHVKLRNREKLKIRREALLNRFRGVSVVEVHQPGSHAA